MMVPSSEFSLMEEHDESQEMQDITGSWHEAYGELMGDDDEVDMFFVLPRPELSRPELIESDEPDDLLVLRVMGQPDHDLAWVH